MKCMCAGLVSVGDTLSWCRVSARGDTCGRLLHLWLTGRLSQRGRLCTPCNAGLDALFASNVSRTLSRGKMMLISSRKRRIRDVVT